MGSFHCCCIRNFFLDLPYYDLLLIRVRLWNNVFAFQTNVLSLHFVSLEQYFSILKYCESHNANVKFSNHTNVKIIENILSTGNCLHPVVDWQYNITLIFMIFILSVSVAISPLIKPLSIPRSFAIQKKFRIFLLKLDLNSNNLIRNLPKFMPNHGHGNFR